MDKKTALDKAVLGLFKNKGATFLSTLYCGLDIQWVGEEVIPTADIDGVTLRLCEPWFLSLSEGMRVTLLAHELWHPSLFHCDPSRFKGKDPDVWNQACDHAINLMLKEHGYVFDVPHLADPRFKGMSAEQIYNILYDGPRVENPFGRDLQPSNKKPEDAEKMKRLVIQSALTAQILDKSGYGELPGQLKTMVEKAMNPKLPWQTLLQRFLNERASSGYSWSVRNRRYRDMYLPGRRSQDALGHVMFAFDSSFSVSDEQIAVYLAETSRVMELFQPQKMTITVFDTKVQSMKHYHRGDSLNKIDIIGRGGTDMTDLMEKVKEHDVQALVVFSDLDCLAPEDPKIPVLFICLDNPNGSMPFGKVVHINSSE